MKRNPQKPKTKKNEQETRETATWIRDGTKERPVVIIIIWFRYRFIVFVILNECQTAFTRFLPSFLLLMDVWSMNMAKAIASCCWSLMLAFCLTGLMWLSSERIWIKNLLLRLPRYSHITWHHRSQSSGANNGQTARVNHTNIAFHKLNACYFLCVFRLNAFHENIANHKIMSILPCFDWKFEIELAIGGNA